MRINSKRLSKAMSAKGVTGEQLADVIASPTFKRPDAARAITNWLDGKDHPRCKAPTIRALAQYLGVRPVDIAKFTSEVRQHRGSPRKAKLLVDLIRGKKVDEAINLLTFTTKKAAVNVKRCLNAAITDAEAAEADTTSLFVSESRVDQGTVMKRFQPKDRGRAHAIEKFFSHITISVEEKPGR